MKKVLSILGFILAAALFAGLALAQGPEVANNAAATGAPNITKGLIGIGVGLAIGLAGIGTGVAQGYIGAAGLGNIAEDRSAIGTAFIFLVIPETIVIFGFLFAILLFGKMG
jgi:V/A-type H+-transporting ATPase subunit K